MKHRSSQANITDSSYAFLPTTVDVEFFDDGYWRAYRHTSLGMVEMQSWRIEQQTFLWFAWQGRMYKRTFDRFYSALWAARLATEFARDVVEGRVGE